MEAPEAAKLAKAKEFIPDDIITEILMHSPMKSLLRFKFLSKEWFTKIEQSWFVHWHLDQYEGPAYAFSEEGGYEAKSSQCGLILEANESLRKYRIRNPLTRHVLYLPDPQRVGSLSYLVKSDKAFKVVSILADNDGSFSCEVLFIGVDDQWRPLEIGLPSLKGLKMVPGDHAAFFVQCSPNSELTDWNKGFFYLDLFNDCFHHCVLPYSFFPGWKNALPLYWKGLLAFAYIAHEDLKVLILKDHKTQEWSEMKITLKFLKENPHMKGKPIAPIYADVCDEILFDTSETMFYYHMGTNEVEYIESLNNLDFSLHIRPSLINLEGMEREAATKSALGCAPENSSQH